MVNKEKLKLNKKLGGWANTAARKLAAHGDGVIAQQLFTTAHAGTVDTNLANLFNAIDNGDPDAFADACENAGINNVDLIDRMWDATMGSLRAQSMKPCW